MDVYRVRKHTVKAIFALMATWGSRRQFYVEASTVHGNGGLRVHQLGGRAARGNARDRLHPSGGLGHAVKRTVSA